MTEMPVPEFIPSRLTSAMHHRVFRLYLFTLQSRTLKKTKRNVLKTELLHIYVIVSAFFFYHLTDLTSVN